LTEQENPVSDTFTPDADLDTDAPDDDQDQPEQQPAKAERNAEKLRKARLAEAELRKELAFAKAGVDTDSTFGKYLLSTFAGEVTTDAIKAHAEAARKELGIPEPTADTTEDDKGEGDDTKPGPEITDDVKGSTDERRDLAGESVPDDGSGVTPAVAAREAYQRVMAQGGTTDAAGAAAAKVIREAANAGDIRAQVVQAR
jgi:hypothetical protein